MCPIKVSFSSPELGKVLERQQQDRPSDNLFAYPLESNFSGTRYDPALVTSLQERFQSEPNKATVNQQDTDENNLHSKQRWWVLLDAAKACSTKPPDLSRDKAHFVVQFSTSYKLATAVLASEYAG